MSYGKTYEPWFLSDLFSESGLSNMAGSTIGSLGPFDSAEESWTSYVERFELFVDCNDIKTEKKVSTFLTVLGVKTYNLLKDLCTPSKPSEKTFDSLVKIVQEHLSPKPSFIAERYKFSLRNQYEHESVAEYIVQLKKLSTYCEFKDNLSDYLRDRLVSGLRSDVIKKRLIGEVDLTYEKAVQLALSLEAAERQTTTMTFHNNATGSTGAARLQRYAPTSGQANNNRQQQQRPHFTRREEKVSSDNKVNKMMCFCCGKYNHVTSVCRYRSYNCNFCHKKGHLEKVCLTKLRNGKQSSYFNKNSRPKEQAQKGYQHNFNKSYSKGRQNFIQVENEVTNDKNSDDIYDVSNLFSIEEKITRVAPIHVNLKVEGVSLPFEIDSGSCVSVISEKCYKTNFSQVKLNETNLCLSSYTNEQIKPVGKLFVKVEINNIVRDLELYVIANGANPLIGRDWIRDLKLTISIPSNINNVADYSQNNNISKTADSQIVNTNIVENLFDEFRTVFCEELGCFKGEPVKLYLKSNATPKYFKPRPIPFSLKAKVEQELDRLVNGGILTPIQSSSWGTPIVPVLKKNGQIRLCGDFKVSLNPYLEVDRHPIPRIEDLFASLQKGETFSTIDLSQAYMQVRLDDESKKLCTISTHKGLFMYNRIPYGISSAPGIFQRIMEQMLVGIPGVVCFLDDILVTGKNQNEHINRLKEVCTRLRNHGLTVSKNKCKLFCKSVEYLGYVVSSEGLSTSPTKIEAILKAPVPTNISQLKGFLGLVNYYSKFVPKMSTIATSLYHLLKKDVPFVWNANCQKSFELIKERLVSAPVLAHYKPELPLRLYTDSSSYGLGCVLTQKQGDGSEKPIAFGSRSLNAAELKYSVIDKEALAIIYGIKKFNQYLFGNKFTLITDHKPLLSVFGPKKGLPAYSASRLQRYALLLSAYDFNIEYIRSEANGHADGLSRIPLNVQDLINTPDNVDNINYVGTYLQCIKENEIPINFKDVQKETRSDPELIKLFRYVSFGWPNMVEQELKPYSLRRSEITIEHDILMWGYRIIIPKNLRMYILNELHTGHLGIVKMKSLARSYIWWPGIDNDIESLVNSCSLCLNERQSPIKSNLHVWEYPEQPWQRIHLDFLGPFKSKLYLIIIDSHSKWLEVEEVTSTSAKQCISRLLPMFARFGIPQHIVTDNGPPFSSFEFANFVRVNGIKHTFTPPYHPASNGQAENSVKTVKKRLKCAILEHLNTEIALSKFLLAYRNCVHSSTKESPAKLMFKRNLRTKFDLLRPSVFETVKMNQEKQISNFGGGKTRILHIGQPVLIRDFRGSNKWINGIVVKQLSPVSYIVKLQSGVTWKRHIDQLIGLQSNVSLDRENDTRELLIPKASFDSRVVSTPVPIAGSPRPSPEIPGSPIPVQATPGRQSWSPADQSKQTTPVFTRRYPVRDRKPVTKLDL